MRAQVRNGRRTDAAIAELAARQHGVVAWGQLVALGFTRSAIERRVAAGRLHLVFRGVYAVGHPSISWHGRVMAGVLAAGKGAVASHSTAAELFGIGSGRRGWPEVTLERTRKPRPGIRFHASSLPPDEIDERDGIAVTSAARTILDLAARFDEARLKNMLDRAEHGRLSSPVPLRALIARYPRRPGTPILSGLLANRSIGVNVTNEELEIRFAAFIDKEGLPRPEVNAPLFVGGRWIIADCLWREAWLVVELDSHEHHQTPEAFEADRRRDRELAAAGYVVIRVTWRALHVDDEAVERDIRRALTRRVRT